MHKKESHPVAANFQLKRKKRERRGRKEKEERKHSAKLPDSQPA
jgi:hypothetical protein